MSRDLFLLATFLVNLLFSPNPPKLLAKADPSPNNNLVKVTRVVDGDTIEIETGQKVRLIGVNAPESVAPRKPVVCFGKEASEFTKSELEGKFVRLEKDVSELDKYGRLLRYIYVDDVMFNEKLVKQGFAMASTYPPDVKYKDKFLEAQKYARDNKLGLWNLCK